MEEAKNDGDPKILIQVKSNKSNESLQIRVKPTTKFEKIFKAFCEKNNL